jgi:oligosaccharide repeat unit polymerase
MYGLYLAIDGLYSASATSMMVLASLIAVPFACVRGRDRIASRNIRLVANNWVKMMVLLSGPAAILAGILTQVSLGRPLILDLGAMLQTSQDVAVARYAGATTPILAVALLSLNFVGAILAPFASDAIANAPMKVYSFISPVLGAAVYAILTTARAGLLISVVLLFGSYAAVSALKGKRGLPKRAMFSLLISSTSILALFIWSMLLRYGDLGGRTWSLIGGRLATYSVGSMPAFDQWYEQSEPHDALNLGLSTFSGFSPFGEREQGSSRGYVEFVTIGDGLHTNVFSVLRSLIEDFGVAGALISIACFLLVAGALYERTIRHRTISMALLLALVTAPILFVGYLSIYSFTNVAVAAVASLVLGRLGLTIDYVDESQPSVPSPSSRVSRARIRSEYPQRR